LTQEEKDVLRQMLLVWSNITNKKSWEVYILTTVASKIQDMNVQHKVTKILWEKRLQICYIL